jgi:hypothetical protein
VQIALFAKGNHLLYERTHRLGLGHGRFHTIFQKHGRRQIPQQSAAVAGVASEFESSIAMAHDDNLQKQLLASSFQLLALTSPKQEDLVSTG